MSRARFAAIAVALWPSFAADAGQANLLRNPSFEAGSAGKPAGWSLGRIYGPGPLHFDWAAQARTGRRSLRVTSLHATQFAAQDVPLSAGASYVLRIHAKGSGRLRLLVQPRAGNQVVKPEGQADWTLTDRWLPYQIAGTVPPGAQRVRLHVITPMRGCDVFLDDAAAWVGAPEAIDTADAAPSSAERLNITPLCRLETVPYADPRIADLCDGETRWGGVAPEHGAGRGARFTFRPPRPATVLGVEFLQTRAATSYLIDADSDGDGQFDTTLARVTGRGRSRVWTTHAWPPAVVHAVRFCALQGPDRYGRCYPTLREFVLWAKPEPWMQPPPAPRPPQDGPPELRAFIPPRGLPTVTRDLSVPMAQRTARGVFIESWMFGLGKTTPPPFEELRSLDAFLRHLDDVGADHVMLFPHLTGARCPIWPSRFLEGSAWDVLSPLVQTLKQRQIRTFVIFGRPSQRKQEHLPWPEWYGGLLREVVSRGAHGASICLDEFPQCGGGEPDPQHYRAALKRELGVEAAPQFAEDTPAYRRWRAFHYRQVALAHKQAADRALALNPDFLFFSNWRVDPVALNSTAGRLAYDVLADATQIPYFGTDPYFDEAGRRPYMERTVKLLVAANRPRGALPILKGGSWDFERLEDYPGILINGSAVASVMHGAAGVSFYRLNYLYLNNKSHLVREASRIIEWLDQAGLRETRTAPAIAVLHSRASEDFWQLRHEHALGADLRVDGIRGYVAQKAFEELLLRHSYPFEIHYLDREDDLADLGRYALVALPFPYCLSDRAAQAVESAWRAGAQVLLCERVGEADELGTRRPRPAFHDWPDRDRVTFVPNLVDRMADPAFQQSVRASLDAALGRRKPLSLWSYGRDVEAIVRTGSRGQILLALINWERGDVVADVGLHLPQGQYQVTQCDGHGVRPATVAKGRDVTASDLAKFRVRLSRDQVRVYDIRPKR